VVATEHQFVDREAMIPPGGGEPISVPWATDTTGGMITDAMAVKFAAIPSDSQSAAQVLATLSSSAVRTYYETNWSRQVWYLDAVNGDDSATGYEEAHPLQTTEELTARLAVPVPIDHPVTVYVAQGSYGTLAVRVIQTALACPFDVVGAVAHTSIGTVTTYTDRVAAPNTEARLSASGVTDWTSHLGKRVDVLDGSSSGAVTWVGKVSAGSLGVDVAGVVQFAVPGAPDTFQSSTSAPAPGSALSLATLPYISTMMVNVEKQTPGGASSVVDSRAYSVRNISGGTIILPRGGGQIDGCEFEDIRVDGLRTQAAVSVSRSAITGRLQGASRQATIRESFVYHCLVRQATVATIVGCEVWNSLFYGAMISLDAGSLLRDSGVFDSTYGVIPLQGGFAGRCRIRDLFGSCSAYGVYLSRSTTVVATGNNYIAGGTSSILAGANALPWTALPWVDGERSGEATLAVPGTGHDAESTSYVDVTVPHVLASQKIVASYKTFGGTTGSVLAKYIDATTIRVVSTSSTDTSVVTWHILPVGDNAVIRS
jgi:hypothetical protein